MTGENSGGSGGENEVTLTIECSRGHETVDMEWTDNGGAKCPECGRELEPPSGGFQRMRDQYESEYSERWENPIKCSSGHEAVQMEQIDEKEWKCPICGNGIVAVPEDELPDHDRDGGVLSKVRRWFNV